MATREGEPPVREFFSIGDVCELTELKPHVLRYWESQFKFLNPAKNRSGNRVYTRREVELVQLVKHLLYTEKYTIEGARRKVDEHRRSGGVKPAARRGLDAETVRALEQDLQELLAVLDQPDGPDHPTNRASTDHPGHATKKHRAHPDHGQA